MSRDELIMTIVHYAVMSTVYKTYSIKKKKKKTKKNKQTNKTKQHALSVHCTITGKYTKKWLVPHHGLKNLTAETFYHL